MTADFRQAAALAAVRKDRCKLRRQAVSPGGKADGSAEAGAQAIKKGEKYRKGKAGIGIGSVLIFREKSQYYENF